MGGAGHGPQDAQSYQRELERAIQEKQLQRFYGPGSPGQQMIPQIAQRAAQAVERVVQAWRIPREIANDIVRLALYDVVIYIDDSGSMAFEEDGERIKDLKLILQRVAFAATLFDDDGIDLRFMNEDLPPNQVSGIRSEQQVDAILAGHRFKGITPLGKQLKNKVIDSMLLPKLHSGQMRKPLLIITITDGEPSPEDGKHNPLKDVVRTAIRAAQSSPYGPGAIAFQFAQVGNDQDATKFLATIDNDAEVGREVDCTSSELTCLSDSKAVYADRRAQILRTNPNKWHGLVLP